MSSPKVSIITASRRPDGLVLSDKCLRASTVQEYEWLICLPPDMAAKMKIHDPRARIFADPPKREGDFYRLNAAWNLMIREAKADLLVFLCDWIWFEPQAIEQLIAHYEDDRNRGVSSIGHHYRKLINGRPELLWTFDDRPTQLDSQAEDRWKINYMGMELALAALPKAPLLEVGGFDEEYDKHFGMSEKEACLRMHKVCGTTFILDRTRTHRTYSHNREWTPDEQKARYLGAVKLFSQHAKKIATGERTTIPWETP